MKRILFFYIYFGLFKLYAMDHINPEEIESIFNNCYFCNLSEIKEGDLSPFDIDIEQTEFHKIFDEKELNGREIDKYQYNFENEISEGFRKIFKYGILIGKISKKAIFLCPCLQFKTNNEIEMKKHLKEHKNDLNKFECPYKDCVFKKFSGITRFFSHITSHFDYKNYKCIECYRKYKTRFNLLEHYKRVHYNYKKKIGLLTFVKISNSNSKKKHN